MDKIRNMIRHKQVEGKLLQTIASQQSQLTFMFYLFRILRYPEKNKIFRCNP
jgi:hypothetical protein